MLMKNKNLRIISYNNPELFDEEFNQRYNSSGTFRTGLYIVPFSTVKGERLPNEKYELFSVSRTENLILEDKILRKSAKIRELFSELPPIAQNKMLFSQMINEIQSTNDIEGVRSTRKELNEAARHKNSKSKVRFKGIVSQYLNIGESEYESIQELKDFRKIFDNLFLDDMEEDNLPDGELFRKDVVYIQDERQNVHQGSPNEKLIKDDLFNLIKFMNSNSFPFLLKAAITHYYFEYVHPFYDGNGRMGRFILSSYLSKKLDKFTGVSISNAIGSNKQKYLDAFIEVSHPRNRGEVTHFVKTLYELIIEGQDKLIEDLIEYVARFKYSVNYLDTLENLDEIEKGVIFIYMQNHIFEEYTNIQDTDVREISKLSRYKLKNALDGLEVKGFVKQIKQNPSVHVLSDEFLMKIEHE